MKRKQEVARKPIPDKCLDCNHTIIQFENVNQGFCKYQIESVVRCDCSPGQFRVGCVCAEMYCAKKGENYDG